MTPFWFAPATVGFLDPFPDIPGEVADPECVRREAPDWRGVGKAIGVSRDDLPPGYLVIIAEICHPIRRGHGWPHGKWFVI